MVLVMSMVLVSVGVSGHFGLFGNGLRMHCKSIFGTSAPKKSKLQNE